MAVEYTLHDRALCDQVIVQFQSELEGSRKVEFQFPPRVPSDNRSGTWNEGNLPGREPYATFQVSGPRELTVTWTYVMDGDRWNATRIKRNVRRVRGYFQQIGEIPGRTRNLIVDIKLLGIGGEDVMTARIRGVQVRQSDALITDRSVQPPLTVPLRTDLTVDMRLWVQRNNNQCRSGSVAPGDPGFINRIDGLRACLPTTWY